MGYLACRAREAGVGLVIGLVRPFSVKTVRMAHSSKGSRAVRICEASA